MYQCTCCSSLLYLGQFYAPRLYRVFLYFPIKDYSITVICLVSLRLSLLCWLIVPYNGVEIGVEKTVQGVIIEVHRPDRPVSIQITLSAFFAHV